MFAVVRYFNYRKDVDFEVLTIHNDFTSADSSARSLAYASGDGDVVDTIEEWCAQVTGALVEYTTGNGYQRDVFAVVGVGADARVVKSSSCDFCRKEGHLAEDCRNKKWFEKNSV